MSEGVKLWDMPKSLKSSLNDISKIYKMKHGMFAGVPIICKTEKCPYRSVCILKLEELEEGTRCPMEAGAILARFEMWCAHFGVDISKDELKKEDIVDVSLIKDLVDNEIQTLRVDNRIAMSADFIAKTIASVDNKGRVYYEDTVSPEAQFKLQLLDKRHKILQLLNSTRKDKSKELKNGNSASVKALGILQKVSELLPDNLDNIDFEKGE